MAGAEQGDERAAGVVRPPPIELGSGGGHPVERGPIDGHSLACRDGSRAQHERRVGSDVQLGIDVQCTLAQLQASPERVVATQCTSQRSRK